MSFVKYHLFTVFNFSLSLFLSHENIVPLRHADFRRDRLSEKLHGFDVSLGAVDVRASLTDQLRDGPLLWIQSREYAMLRKVRLAARPHGTPAASGNQLERARNFSPGCNFCVPWHYARVFINRLVGKFAQTVLKPNVPTDGKYDDPTGAFLFYFIADDESREPLCARAKSLLPLFEFIDHSYSRDIGRLLENKRIDLGRVSTNFSIGTKETIEFWISYLWRKWILLCRKYKKYFVRYFNNLILIILFVIMIYKKSNILIVTIIFIVFKVSVTSIWRNFLKSRNKIIDEKKKNNYF